MACHGDGGDHCCYINGTTCPFLEEGTVEGRRWACGLLRELGTWQAVYADRRWSGSDIAAWFNQRYPGFGCGDWPQNVMDITAQHPNVGLCCYG